VERDDRGKPLPAFGQVDDVAVLGGPPEFGDMVSDLTEWQFVSRPCHAARITVTTTVACARNLKGVDRPHRRDASP
jgi:hypothetical protein